MSDETFRIVVAGGVIIAALSFLVLGVVAALLASVAFKLKARLDPILEKVNPLVGTFKETAADLKPKISSISAHAVEVSKLVSVEAQRYSGVAKDFAVKAADLSELVKTEAHHYSQVSRGFVAKAEDISGLVQTEAHRYADISKDVAERTRVHVAQADRALDEAVVQVQSAAGSAKHAVLRPFREIDGVFTGIGAAFATFARGRKASVSNATQDEEMFI